LNTDPLTDANFASLDYAWYPNLSGIAHIYESGSNIGDFGAYTTSTVFLITYDGQFVRYYMDGVVKRTVARAMGAPLYLDSSLWGVKATPLVTDVSFGSFGAVGPGSDIEVPNGMAAIGGRLVVGARPNSKLAATITNAQTTITVDHSVWVNGDRIMLQAVKGGTQQTEFMAVTSAASGTGPFTYSVTRGLNGSAFVWHAGDTIVNLGTTGSHFIDQYTVRGIKAATEVGPTLVGNVRNSATWNDWAPRWAIGNLNGLFGYASNIYGFAAGNPTGPWIKVDPTNGVRIGHNATTRIHLDASGNASFTGEITASGGTIAGWTIGATEFSDPSNFIRFNSSLGRISIGSGTIAYGSATTYFYADKNGQFSLGNKFLWDGANLTVISGNYRLDYSGFEVYSGTVQLGGLRIHSTDTVELWSGASSLRLISGLTPRFNAGLELDGGLYIKDGWGTYRYVVGVPGAAVANATGTGDIVARFNELLSRLRISSGTHGLIIG
jgi:hypothetical protein